MDKRTMKLLKKLYKRDKITFINGNEELMCLLRNKYVRIIYEDELDSGGGLIPTNDYEITTEGRSAYEQRRYEVLWHWVPIIISLVATAVSIWAKLT